MTRALSFLVETLIIPYINSSVHHRICETSILMLLFLFSGSMKQFQFSDNMPCVHGLPIPEFLQRLEICNSKCQARERAALLNFYKQTNGHHWRENKHWGNTSIPHCHWYGVVCNSHSGHVITLSLINNNLEGTWSNSFGDLTHLVGLCLRWNKIRGNLQQIWSTLTGKHLIRIDVGYNKINGVVPWQQIFENQGLLKLQLAGNSKLSGTIPSNISALRNLSFLVLSGTQIRGTIPQSLISLSKLRVVGFTSLKLKGDLSVFLSMRKLAYVLLSGNHLSGNIPSNINISLPNIKTLHLQFNNLTGCIPDSIGHLKHLRYINLQGNPLTGVIPYTVRFLTKLETFILGRTQVTGFDKGAYFNSKHFVNFNTWKAKKFKCSFQRLMQVLQATKPSLVRINMRGTQVHGHFTSEVFQFRRLVWIDFNSCQLNGWLPDPIISFKETQSLTKIILRGNHLKGAIPSSYSSLKNLYLLVLSGNKEMHGDLDGILRKDYKVLSREDRNTEYSCPSLKFIHNGGSVIIDPSYYHRKYCFCNKGYYGIGGTCKKCMTGGICDRHSLQKVSAKGKGILQTEMVLKAGYWPFKSWQNVTRLVKCSDFSIEREICNPKGVCTCSINITLSQSFENGFLQTVCNKTCICADGHKGRFCSQCHNGYFTYGATCVICPKGINLEKRAVLIISSSFTLFVLLIVAKVLLSRKRKKLALVFAIINISSAIILTIYRIVPIYISQINIIILILSLGWLADSCKGLVNTGIFYIQILDSLISSINIWPTAAYKLHYYVIGPFNFQFDSLYCNIPELFTVTTHLITTLALPVVAIFVIWVTYIVAYIFKLWKHQDNKTNFKLKCRNYSLLVLDISYFPVVKKVFFILPPCRKLEDISFMPNFVWVDCQSNTHKTLLTMASLAVPTYILGIPCFIFLPLLYRNRHMLNADNTYTSKWLGSLYQLYEPQYRIYMKPLMMTLRMLIAMALAIIPSNSIFQTIFIIVILFTAVILQTHTKPNRRYHGNMNSPEDSHNDIPRKQNKMGLENMFAVATLSVLQVTFILERFYLMSSNKKVRLILFWMMAVPNSALMAALVLVICVRSTCKTGTSTYTNAYVTCDATLYSQSRNHDPLLVPQQ